MTSTPPSKTSILLFGADGRLGRAFSRTLSLDHTITLHAWNRSLCDVTCSLDMAQAIRQHAPQVIINCSAYNGMEQCEKSPALAFATNTQAPAQMAEAARDMGALFIHFSTDYACTLNSKFARTERCLPEPCGIYGLSKLLGERAVMAIDPYHMIFRVASLYGNDFKGSLSAVREVRLDSRAGTHEKPIRVLKQQTTPTSVDFIVENVLAALESALLSPRSCSGIYNLVPCDLVWKSDFARLALEYFEPLRADSVIVVEGMLQVPRPELSWLNNRKFQDTFGIKLASVYEDLNNFAMLQEAEVTAPPMQHPQTPEQPPSSPLSPKPA